MLFAKTKRDSLRFVFATTLSVLLLIMDSHGQHADRLRRLLSMVAFPIQYVSDAPVRIMRAAHLFVSDKDSLLQENELLRRQQLHLQAKLQKLKAIRHENNELKSLLDLSDLSGGRVAAARVLTVDTSRNRQVWVINKGTQDGVFSGQPVLDQQGILGQVIDVGLMTSTVLLISDGLSAVPVQNNRTGEMGILAGTNSTTQLSLIHLSKTSNIMMGDLLVTSGLGDRYPEGYPVGRVTDVVSTPGDEFIKVRVAPLALLQQSRLVLLLWPEEHQPILSTYMARHLSMAQVKA